MNLNDDVVYRCLRLGSVHQLHRGRSSSLVRHHDRFHRPSPCVWYVVIFRIPLRTIENTARNSMVQFWEVWDSWRAGGSETCTEIVPERQPELPARLCREVQVRRVLILSAAP